ncbi:transmembrane protein 249-like [Callorhinchus milii]|uniref:transmembrane protein 249-like n=1 Tax=Callorhinchus milii TaxID=7868 RepID=UPI001C3F6719|nr:transmembrane protein 249-like [Callorhinchus milii]
MFNTWAITLPKTEDILHKKLKMNPYHPFTCNQPNGEDHQQFSGFFILLLILALWMIFSSIGKRYLVLDMNMGMYKFYISGHLHFQGPLYNIYIRLKAQKNGYGELLYKLILNGENIEHQDLTGIRFSEAPEKLERLGKRMASKLNLNYFDHLDKSDKHIIRHKPPIWLQDDTAISQCEFRSMCN